MQVTKHNWVGLYYWVDEQNYLVLGVQGKPSGVFCAKGRQPVFTKAVDGQANRYQAEIESAWQ